MYKGKHFYLEDKRSIRKRNIILCIVAISILFAMGIFGCAMLEVLGTQPLSTDSTSESQSMTLGVSIVSEKDYIQYPTRFVQPTHNNIETENIYGY